MERCIMALNESTSSMRTGRTVVGLFYNRVEAESAIEGLKRAGFTNEQIGVAMRDRGEQRELAEGSETEVAAGAATGAISGGIVGGLIGLLGSLLIPGIGPVVAGGVLASTLVGAGAGAATGGIIGALVGMGLSEEEAAHFDTRFREGGILVTVNAGDRTDQALDILQGHGADLGPLRTAERQRAAASSSDVSQTTWLPEESRGAEPIIGRQPPAEPLAATGDLAEPLSPGEVRIGWEEEIEVRSQGDVSARPSGPAGRRPTYSGRERRRSRDTSYVGPERRQATL
jgi:hypothetical protein